MSSGRQVWVNIVLVVVLVLVVVGGVFVYNDLLGLERRVDGVETKSRALDTRIQSLELKVKEMKEQNSGGLIATVKNFFYGIFRFVVGLFRGIINAVLGICGMSI